MSVNWNPELIDGPIVIVLHGDDLDPETGERLPIGLYSKYRLNVPMPAYEARTQAIIGGSLPEAADMVPFRVYPAKMARVFAGDDPENPTLTVALEFKDEAEAVSVLGEEFMLEIDDE